jgi:hypothetical protein
MEYRAEEVGERLEGALQRLLEYDSYLLEQNLNERSISHKLAVHLGDEFPEWDVDCEYNREFDRVKRVDIEVPDPSADDTEAKTVYPDIIIHQRNEEDNLLVVEVKKSNNTDSGDYDIRKLEAFQRDLNYRNAYFVMINVHEIGHEMHEQ